MIELDELIKHYECLDKVTFWSRGTWVRRSKDARCAEDAEDAGNLRCASGMQRCTDADVQGGNRFLIVFGGYPGLLCKLFCKLMKRPSLMQQILMSRCNIAEP